MPPAVLGTDISKGPGWAVKLAPSLPVHPGPCAVCPPSPMVHRSATFLWGGLLHAGDSHPPAQVSQWLSGVCGPLWRGLGGPAPSALSRHEHHMWPADKQSGAGAEVHAGIPGSCIGTGRASAPLVAGRPLRAGTNPAGWSLWAGACLTGGHGHCPRVVLSKGCGPPSLDLGEQNKGSREHAQSGSPAGQRCGHPVQASG